MAAREQIMYRLEIMRRLAVKFNNARIRLSEPIVDFSDIDGQKVELSTALRTKTRNELLGALTRLEVQADALIALGTPNRGWLDSKKPSQALSEIGQMQQAVANMTLTLPLQLVDGEYGQVPTADELTELNDTAASVGALAKQYASTLRADLGA